MERAVDNAEPLIQRMRQGGQTELAELMTQNRERLRRMVHARLDRRVAGRVDPSDVLQETFLDASRQLRHYLADPPMPPFLWLRFLTGQRLMATHRRHLGAQMRDAKQEVPIRSGRRPGTPGPQHRLPESYGAASGRRPEGSGRGCRSILCWGG